MTTSATMTTDSHHSSNERVLALQLRDAIAWLESTVVPTQAQWDMHHRALRRIAELLERPATETSGDSHAFKNFHRALCARFSYSHDEKDWRRDQISLIEWIATQMETPDNNARETTTPQAAIARVTVKNGMAVDAGLYAPGLPDGRHDLYCEPVSVVPYSSEKTDEKCEHGIPRRFCTAVHEEKAP